MQQQYALRELSNNTSIVIMEANKGRAIAIINKKVNVHDCNNNGTYLKTTSNMVETHNEEANGVIGNISSNNRLRISQLFPVKATPGTFYALTKLHKLNHLICTIANKRQLNQHSTTDRQIEQRKHKAPKQTYSICEKDTNRTYFWIY